MLDEKQQATEITGLTGADIVICLQVISRLVSSGNIQDVELAPVGTARNNMVKALEAATGTNFDQARAAQQRAVREAQQQAQAAQAAPAEAPAAEEVTAEAVADAGDSTEEASA